MASKIFEWMKTIGPTRQRLMVVAAVGAVWTALCIEWLEEQHQLKLLFPSLYPRNSFDTRNEIIRALFAAIPGLTAILLLFAPRARTAAQSILKGIALVFLIVSPLWSNLYLWIALIGPFIYALGAVILGLIEARRIKREAAVVEAGETAGKINSAQWWLVALIAAFTIGALLYRILMHQGLGHSAAMFLGIPSVLAIMLALTPKAKTVTGGILKGITLALLIIAPLLGEGYLCILVASPLFYLVGVVIGVIADRLRQSRSATLSCLALVLLPMSLEGVIPELSFNRGQTVEVSGVVDASAEAVEHQLAQSPDITKRLPAGLRIGFPRPLAAWGNGLQIGAIRTIHFAGAEGDPPGDLVMSVTEHRLGFVRFETVSDSSKLRQWIAWDSSEVEWEQVDRARTRVRWRVHFERQLDPAWYFTPMERAAVSQAAHYLIDTNAAPQAPSGSR